MSEKLIYWGKWAGVFLVLFIAVFFIWESLKPFKGDVVWAGVVDFNCPATGRLWSYRAGPFLDPGEARKWAQAAANSINSTPPAKVRDPVTYLYGMTGEMRVFDKEQAPGETTLDCANWLAAPTAQ